VDDDSAPVVVLESVRLVAAVVVDVGGVRRVARVVSVTAVESSCVCRRGVGRTVTAAPVVASPYKYLA